MKQVHEIMEAYKKGAGDQSKAGLLTARKGALEQAPTGERVTKRLDRVNKKIGKLPPVNKPPANNAPPQPLPVSTGGKPKPQRMPPVSTEATQSLATGSNKNA